MLLQNTNDLLVAETGSLHFLSPGVENRLTSNRGHSRGAGQGFSFLVPFEASIVSAALTGHHPAWKTGDQFLEKILDYRLEMPTLAETARTALLLDTVGKVAPAFRVDLTADALTYLPPNPRRIKALARTFQPMNTELARHKPDELDWRSLLFAAILRGENETAFKAYTRRLLKENSTDMDYSMLNAEDRIARHNEILEQAFSGAGVDGKAKEHLVSIASAWASSTDFNWISKVSYILSINEAPENLTWKEFEDALDLWRATANIQEVRTFLFDRASQDRRSSNEVLKEMCASLPSRYHLLLASAADSFLSSDHQSKIEEAIPIADLIEALALSELDPELKHTLFQGFLHVVSQWSHFKTNPADRQIRERELTILTRILENAEGNWKEFAEDVLVLRGSMSKGGKNLFDELVPRLSHFSNLAVEEVLIAFRTSGGVEALIASDRNKMVQTVLLDTKGPAWTPVGGSALDALLGPATTHSAIQANARSLLDRIVAERLPYLDGAAFAQTFGQDHHVIKLLWLTLTAQPVQYRMHGSIRETRQELLEKGIPDSLLVVPDWLTPAQSSIGSE
jgi:hypothetical protein